MGCRETRRTEGERRGFPLVFHLILTLRDVRKAGYLANGGDLSLSLCFFSSGTVVCPTTGGPVVGGWNGAITCAWIMRAAETFPFAWRDQRLRGPNGVSWAGWRDFFWFRTMGSGSATPR